MLVMEMEIDSSMRMKSGRRSRFVETGLALTIDKQWVESLKPGPGEYLLAHEIITSTTYTTAITTHQSLELKLLSRGSSLPYRST